MAGINVVGVQFRRAGKIYDFDAKDFLLNIGDKVVVETERGPSLAEVMRIGFFSTTDRDPASLKPIVRIATKKDLESSGRLTPEYAMEFAKEKIKKLELDMHVINVEVQFGGNKVIIYFSAPGRVDFRELVKELAGGLKTRVELKQVGARDEAKLAGGIGICGREFCCSSFLREFVPVSIKMAKNQNLALNPSKVSGGCGRLLCCLTYEDETYTELRQKLLPKGTRVRLPDGSIADVIKGDILNQLMLVETDSGEQRSVPVNELEVVEVSQNVGDGWGDDIDFDSLLGDEEIAALDDSEQILQQLAKSESAENNIALDNGVENRKQRQSRREQRSNEGSAREKQRDEGDKRKARGESHSSNAKDVEGRARHGGNKRHRSQRHDKNRNGEGEHQRQQDGNRKPHHGKRPAKNRPPEGGEG